MSALFAQLALQCTTAHSQLFGNHLTRGCLLFKHQAQYILDLIRHSLILIQAGQKLRGMFK